jgi:hypothetical protein
MVIHLAKLGDTMVEMASLHLARSDTLYLSSPKKKVFGRGA